MTQQTIDVLTDDVSREGLSGVAGRLAMGGAQVDHPLFNWLSNCATSATL